MRSASLRKDPPSQAATGRPPLLHHRVAGLFVLAGLLALAVLASFAIGAEHVPLDRVIPGVFEPDGSRSALIIQELRLPRTLLGLAVGISLGLAGALMQALTRNPMAEPGILGVNGGAAFAVVLFIALADVTEPLVYVWAAFAGAAGAMLLVYLIGSFGRGGATPGRLVLAGAALNAVFSALTAGIMLLDPHNFNTFRFWQVGTLAMRDLEVLAQLVGFMLAGVWLALLLARPLNVLALGEDAGRALGGNPERIRMWGAVAVVLLSGSATAAVGPIAFLGLAVPFAARALVGPDQRWVLPYSLLLAPVLLLGADIIGRVLASPAELETGIVTAFLGAPLFIMMVRRGRVPKL